MAHFAKLNENNTVLSIHVVNNDVITVDGNESEQAGIDFLTSLHSHTNWKQCSYNATFRKNYPGVGFTYNAEHDGFVSPQPWASWVLDPVTCQWEAPVAMPTDGKIYMWDEATTSWVEIPNPTLTV